MKLAFYYFSSGREFKDVLKCLSKRNRVRVWSEIWYDIFGLGLK